MDHLAREHEITATVGLSINDQRWAGGTPLIDEEGVPYAVCLGLPKPRRAAK
ncbi:MULTISPECIES: hypothetical protein [unclassified Streptomyces]|uniref:hypothetical protein n=1 Tax=unclassified Streptomyces TaxID=2593676 RepID=UPI001BE71F13|nr:MULTISPECIES: hypothetical protein [unclassified Streptomyces]MBT2407260.1 hypothetical protein [Streptomyces sp. ISL-21]MBT2455632.1 hypothetical protein [Streptomyces sp. ISL-86]MBT2613494.1 hypothetical protein [Streptomyces sp. ISL-87]